MAELWRRTSETKKSTLQTVGKETPKKFGDLEKSKKKLDGIPEGVLEKFDELFQTSSELFFECSKFSKKDMSESFKALESHAVSLVRKKKVVTDSIDALFHIYMEQKYPKHYPRAIALKKESRLIIERVQRSIETCRPLMEEVRKKQNDSGEENSANLNDTDFGDDFDSPFDQQED
ncbi:MAG: hypothetical protein HQM13_09095 [SAR324 cluster bacterium]|nr:hypothetical protein [SAR324 cluster bacterium]